MNILVSFLNMKNLPQPVIHYIREVSQFLNNKMRIDSKEDIKSDLKMGNSIRKRP